MRRLVVSALLVAGGIIGWLYWQQTRRPSLIVSGYIEADQIRVGSRVGGRVSRVLVQEGEHVEADAPLIEIDPFDLDDQWAEAEAALAAARADAARLTAGFRSEDIEQARARRDAARARLERLVAGPRPQEIEIARETLNREQADLELAESEYARIARLQEKKQAAPTEIDETTRGLKSARSAVAAARQQLALLEAGTRKEEIAEARAALAETEQALKRLEAGYRKEDLARAAAQVAAMEARAAAIQARRRELTVAAPCACVVETIDLQPGDLVPANAPSVSLLDLSRIWVRSYVPASRLGEIGPGWRVPIVVDGFPAKRFYGRVTFISHEAEFTPRNVQTPEERSKQVFRIKVTLDAPGRDRLRVGMGADVLLGEATRP